MFFSLSKKFIILILAIIGFLINNSPIFSYDDTVIHPSLTEKMAKLYNLNFGDKLTNEEIQWMKQGSIDEDKSLGLAIRSENHFYNPFGSRKWVDESFRGQVVPEIALTSKEWAHNSLAQATFPGGDYTWERAIKDYVMGDKQHAYESLGHILHLIEDSAVPAHTRNDLHISPKELENYKNGGIWEKIAGYYLTDYEPYEMWTGNKAKAGNLEFNFAENLFQENKKPIILDNLDKYFDNIALYTSTRFLSKDTINAFDNPKILYEKNEKMPNGKTVGYGYGIDENYINFRLAKIDLASSEKTYVININTEGVEKIHSDYWSRLAPSAVLNGAGAIKLFKDEAEKAAQTRKLADVLPLYKSLYKISCGLEDRTGPAVIRNFFVGKQIFNNFAAYGFKEEMKLAARTLVSTGAAIKTAATEFSNALASGIKQTQTKLGSFLYSVQNGIFGMSAPVLVGSELGGTAANQNGQINSEASAADNEKDEKNLLASDGEISNISENQNDSTENKIISLNPGGVPAEQEETTGANAYNEIFQAEQSDSAASGNNFITGDKNKNLIPKPQNAPVNLPQEKDKEFLPEKNSENNSAIQSNNSPVYQFFLTSSPRGENIVSAVSPVILTPTPNPAPTVIPSREPAPTPALPSVPTLTPTPTPVFSPTSTPTFTPTPILTPSPIPTLTPASIPILTPTPTPIPALIPNLPEAVSDLSAEMGGKRGQVSLSWSAPLNAFSFDVIVEGFGLENQASGYFVSNVHASEEGASRYLTIDNLLPGKEYSFSIKSKSKESEIYSMSNIAAAISNAAADYLVISEIQIGGEKAGEEFIEIYNLAEEDIDLDALPLHLHIINSKGKDVDKQLTFYSKTIKSRGYFLVASEEYKGAIPADAVYSASGNSLVANGAAYISRSAKDKENIIDLAGWGNQSESGCEGNPFGGINKNQSLERKAGYGSTAESMAKGKDKYSGNSWDSNDNSQDFILRDNPDPRNSRDSYTEPRENTPPKISIVSPKGNQMFPRGESINFEANASDAEDYFIADENIAWSFDGAGNIINGAKFSLDNLSGGAHAVTVNAVDSDGAPASAYEDIFVRNNIWIKSDIAAKDKNSGQIKNLNNPSAAADSKGNLHIAAIEPVNYGDLIYITNENGEWEAENILENDSRINVDYAEIKIDKNGNIYVFYEAWSSCFPYVYYIKKSGGNWSLPQALFSLSAADHYSAALDGNGDIHSLINSAAPINYCMSAIDEGLRYNHTKDGILQKEIIVSPPENVSIFLPSIAANPSGALYLFAVSRSDNSQIFFTYFNSSISDFNPWEKINLKKVVNASFSLIPGFDKESGIHILLIGDLAGGGDRSIWHLASSDFIDWTEEELPDASGADISIFRDWRTNFVFDSYDKIHFVWQKDNNLYYQTNLSGEWSRPSRIIEGAARPSLAIDDADNFHLVYQFFSSHILSQLGFAEN